MRLFGEYSGNKYLNSSLSISTDNDKARVRVGASIVKDEKTGRVMVKLVNMLPAETDLDVDLSKVLPNNASYTIERTVMTGAPADTTPDIMEDTVTENSPSFKVKMPAYSFTVLTYVP